MLEKIAHPNIQDDDLMQLMNIEVSESLLRVKSDLTYDDFDLSRTIERVFRNSTSWADD